MHWLRSPYTVTLDADSLALASRHSDSDMKSFSYERDFRKTGPNARIDELTLNYTMYEIRMPAAQIHALDNIQSIRQKRY